MNPDAGAAGSVASASYFVHAYNGPAWGWSGVQSTLNHGFPRACHFRKLQVCRTGRARTWRGAWSSRPDFSGFKPGNPQAQPCPDRLALCYDSPVLRHTGLASRLDKAQQAARHASDSGFFHVLMLREAARCIPISTLRPARGVRVWRSVWGTREGAPDLRPVRQPARACLPLIGVEGGRF